MDQGTERIIYSLHHSQVHKHDDICCTYVCTIEEIDLEISRSKSTDVLMCIPQQTMLLRRSSKPDDYYSSPHISIYSTIHESIRMRVFNEVNEVISNATSAIMKEHNLHGYYGCEVHMKPEGRCPNDGQECSLNWYD